MKVLRGALLAAVLLLAPTLALTAAPAATSGSVLSFAAATYGPDTAYRASAVSLGVFETSFPDYDLYAVEELTRLPPIRHHLAVKKDASAAYDVTKGWNDLLMSSGTLITTPQTALQLAQAYAATAMVEQLTPHVLVNASWSSTLGVAIADPRVDAGVGDLVVTLSTWSPENGVVANWRITIQPTGFVEARWSVNSVGSGPAADTWETVNLRKGDTVRMGYNSAPWGLSGTRTNAYGLTVSMRFHDQLTGVACPVFATRAAFDGAVWEVCYPDAGYVPFNVVSAGTDALNSAVKAYNAMVDANKAPCAKGARQQALGFEILDWDCRFIIVMLTERDLVCEGCVVIRPPCAPSPCVSDGRIYLDPAFRETLRAKQVYTDYSRHTRQSVADVVLAHEVFHLVQYGILGGNAFAYPRTLIEGTARFMETVLEPHVTFHQSSLFYHPGAEASKTATGTLGAALKSTIMGGAQGYQKYPATDVCNLHYASAPIWGTLHQQEGASALKRALEAARTHAHNEDCHTILEHALKSGVSGTTAEVHELLVDASAGSYASRFPWADKQGITFQWGTFLTPATTMGVAQPGSTVTVAGAERWGHAFLPISGGAVVVSCETTGAGSGHLIFVSSSSVWREAMTCDGVFTRSFDTAEYAGVAFALHSEIADERATPPSALVRVRAQT